MYIWVPIFEVALDDSIHIEGGRTDSPGETSALPRLYCYVVAVSLHLLQLYHIICVYVPHLMYVCVTLSAAMQ
jgi:hypothetical protein